MPLNSLVIFEPSSEYGAILLVILVAIYGKIRGM